jgi:His-Xaa-Ser system radical SAM maturase HxsB
VVVNAPLGRFKSLEHFNESLKTEYKLLPFRFIRLDDERYILTNMAGEYIVVNQESLLRYSKKRLSTEDDLYNTLKSKHFLYDGDSNVALELLALKVRTKMAPIASFTSLHMFVTTLRCDHSCPYCQVSRQSENRLAFDMTSETADKALDFTFKSPNPAIKIEFQGGESLLNFEMVQYVVKEALRRNVEEKRNLQFVIATNLALLTDDVLDFCLQYNVLVSTSLDGPVALHNANRPRPGNDSYERTIQNINRVRAVLGPDRVSALMTTTKSSLPRVTEIIDEYLRQDFNSIFLRPLSPYGFAIKTKSFDAYETEEWLDFYKEGLAYILELNKQGTFFVEEFTSLLLQKMLTPLGTSYVDLQSPAGIGISGIIFNYDGDVYASDEARMLAEMGHKNFRLGNLHSETYEDIMLSDALLDSLEQTITESVPVCNDCGFQPYCGSEPVYHYATQGDIVGNKSKSGFCQKNMGMLRHLIALMEDDPEAKRILMNWVRV